MSSQSKITSLEILLSLRQRLLKAKEQNNSKSLVEIQIASDVLCEIAEEIGDVSAASILEDMVSAIRDMLIGEDWKSTIPSIEDIVNATN